MPVGNVKERIGGAEFFDPLGFINTRGRDAGGETATAEGSDKVVKAGGAGINPLQSIIDDLLARMEKENVLAREFAEKQLQAQKSSAGPFQVGPETLFFDPEGRSTRSVQGGFAPGSFGDQLQQLVLRILGGGGVGGGIDLPSRESLLGPRKGDINDIINAAQLQENNRFAGLGRDITGSVPTEVRGGLEERRAREVNRAGGEIDILLSELGLRRDALQQNRETNLLNLILRFLR